MHERNPFRYLLGLLVALCGLPACGIEYTTGTTQRDNGTVRTERAPGASWGTMGGDPQSSEMPVLSGPQAQSEYQQAQRDRKDAGTDAAAPVVGVVNDTRKMVPGPSRPARPIHRPSDEVRAFPTRAAP